MKTDFKAHWQDYLMIFLAIVMGIAITFGGENFFKARQEKEGKQFLRELQRLQMYHDSTPTLEAIESTIENIDEYIGK